MNVEELIQTLSERGTELGLSVLAAIVILVIGRFASRAAGKIARRVISKRFDDPSLSGFAATLVQTGVLIFFVIAAISKVGVETTSFVAVLGAAGLAVGMALQGSLSNFASGVLILIFRPISVGEVVEAGGATGKIEDIGLFATTMATPDNKTIVIANSGITGGNIVNYSRKPSRRVDLVFGIDYGDDIKKAREVLLDVMNSHPKVISEPAAPFVGVVELGDNSVNLAARAWCNTPDYWDVYFELMETVKYRFDAEGLSFPFPQRDVHMHTVAS